MQTIKSQASFRNMFGAAINVFVALCIAYPAFPQEPRKSSSLTLTQAVAIALEKNPQRKAALADAKAAAADVKEARLK